MALIRLDILKREPYLDGRPFGAVGPYERIDAIAHYAVAPDAGPNQRVVDLCRAQTEDGLVRFSGDAAFVVPADTSKGNRAVWLHVPNRGGFPQGEGLDSYWGEQGWATVSCGWQWDVPRGAGRHGLEAPLVPEGSVRRYDTMQLRFQPDENCADLPLTDQHVGERGNHNPIGPMVADDAAAKLLVRDWMYGTAREFPRDTWHFSRDENGAPVPDPHHVWLAGGFEAGRIYDLVYHPATCPVVGSGMLALRDFAIFLKSDRADNPLRGQVEHVIAEGMSQCGRLLRTYLHLGLNVDEAGVQAFDGVFIGVAGGRRGEFNHRYGQPSVQATPSFGHLFPFADAPQRDPRTGRIDGLLSRQREVGGMPKIFYLDSASDYWRGDAGLAHLQLASGEDAEPPAEVRRYLLASVPHAGAGELTHETPFGSRGANLLNAVNAGPLMKAAMVHLLGWLRGVDPPPSVYPRVADGSAMSREAVLDRLAAGGDLVLPDPDRLPALRPLELGPDAASGVGELPATASGEPYPCLVSAIDEAGNEVGGVRLPVIAAPLGIHTGFNPRHPDVGGEGQLLEYVGSFLPFTRERITQLYPDREAYLAAVRVAAEALIERRYVLASDLGTCIDDAAHHYDRVLAFLDGLPAD